MERFLQAYELKDLVCDELFDDKKTLYALARTCRAFVEPSLYHLWKSIDSFEPLVACLPVDSWREEKPRGLFASENTIVYPTRVLNKPDLERYLRRAPRIREFRFKHKRRMRFLSPEFLASLLVATRAEVGVLSPKLSAFAWLPDLHDPWLAPRVHRQIPLTLHLFVGDGVSSLKFTLGKDLDLQPILVTSGRLSKLRYLALSGDVNSTLEEPLSTFSWSNLESISLTGPSEYAIPHLATLPRLATIRVKHLRELEAGPVAESVASDPSSFSALKQAFIHGNTVDFAARFFYYIPLKNSIHTAHCSTSCSASLEECHIAIDILRQRLNPGALDRLEVRDLQNDGSSSFAPAQIVLGEDEDLAEEPALDMSPLFRFTNLKTVILRVTPGVWVTEVEVGEIGNCWSGVEHLDLCGTLPIGRQPSIHYRHLLQLLDGCKGLRVLGLPFDGTDLEEDMEVGAEGGVSLETLRVCGSPIRDVVSVEAVITRTLPQLKDLDTFYHGWLDTSGGSDSRWLQVFSAWNGSR